MLKLLLDEHIPPAVAKGMRRRDRNLIILGMVEWDAGVYLGQEDAILLGAATMHGLTLVTFDRRTIPPLLKKWAEEDRSHAGVIFVDEKTILPSDVGRLVRSLGLLVKQGRDWNWTDKVYFLQR